MNTGGKWDPSQYDEWHRRNRELVIVPAIEVTVEREVPRRPVAPEAFVPPPKKNYGSN
jgi:hypothetical protein